MILTRHTAGFVAALVATTALYAIGLRGTFMFDDFPNIVDNIALHVTQSTLANWLQAAWASPSSDLQRPLASLSFALNHYFTGLDPWPMKATNLAIHLINGLLLYRLLRRLTAIVRPDSATVARDTWLAVLVAAAWLLHPINLGAVLYVVQRMESLAQTFVLLGLLCYVQARLRNARGEHAGWRLWLGVPACTMLGILAKESAALLPLYALLLELTLLRNLPRPRGALTAFFTVFLLIPGLLGSLWLIPAALSESAYAHRAFNLGERLLTEPRVLLDYATWILLPAPDMFSFYRDDYVVSTGWLTPWSTLPALLTIAALGFTAWWLHARRPLVALGLAWFLGAHVLTATVLPLELVFEHRNYFASAGLLLAAFDLVLPRTPDAVFRLARHAAIGAMLALCAVSLAMRSRVWADPLLFAVSEAALHPKSPRATYNLGRTYVVLSGYDVDSPYLQRATEALQVAAHVPRASLLPEVGLLMVASRTGRAADPAWWASMFDKLAQRVPTLEDAEAIKSLTECQREGLCALDDQNMLQLYLAASSHASVNPAVLHSYAIFAQNRLHDSALALRLARDAAQSRDVQYQLNLVNFLIDLQDRPAATAELEVLRRRAKPGSKEDVAIAEVQRRLEQMPGVGQ